MFNTRREKLLLIISLSLLAMLVADALIISPLSNSLRNTDSEIAALQEKIVFASQARLNGSGHKIDTESIRLSSEQGQNKFRQFLESQAGADVIKSSTEKEETPIEGQDELTQITYELKLVGTTETLRAFLDNLDRSDELLRINDVQITSGSLEDQTVNMKLVVSTIARESRGERDEQLEAQRHQLKVAKNPLLLPLPKNMFIPLDLTGKLGKGSTPSEFVLIGTTTKSDTPKACIEFTTTEDSLWVKAGDVVGYITIVKVTSSGVEVEMPSGDDKHLAIGKSSATLWADSKIYADSFELVGISELNGKLFGLIRPSGDDRIYRVGLYDRIGPGRVVKINSKGIVFRVGISRSNIKVGEWYISSDKQ